MHGNACRSTDKMVVLKKGEGVREVQAKRLMCETFSHVDACISSGKRVCLERVFCLCGLLNQDH